MRLAHRFIDARMQRPEINAKTTTKSLEVGLRLDLNRLMRQGCMRARRVFDILDALEKPLLDEEIGCADFTADMRNRHEGGLDIKMGDRQQTVFLVPRPRFFGAANGISFAQP